MIALGDPAHEPDRALLQTPGAFLWWYLDLVDPEGNGMVVIWSFGLPFLPGNGHAARTGRPELPGRRPSVNVAVYRGGAEALYLLQEYDGDSAEMRLLEDGTVRVTIGENTFQSRVVDGRRRVEIRLDCPVPGSRERLRGVVRAEGVACVPGPGADSAGAAHLWTPLAGPAAGEAELRVDNGPTLRVRGRAYHDRNHGRLPLQALGIRRWFWARFPLEDREVIYYLLWPSKGTEPIHLALEIDLQGALRSTHPVATEVVSWRRAFAGLRYPAEIRIVTREGATHTIRQRSAVDDGPFYLRFHSELRTSGGEQAQGWSELCAPDRVDLARHRPFVRMRVHRVGGANSIWLPLFAGPRAGRIGRLVRNLAGRSAP